MPHWLRERIDLALAARLGVGEDVSPAESARDQTVAFRTLTVRHRPDLMGDRWLRLPDPRLEERLAALDALFAEIH